MSIKEYGSEEFFTKKAKKESYAARSVYKLQEIDEKYQLFKSGQKVLDLGCYPGSWSQYACQKVGKKGYVLGIDVQKMTIPMPSHFKFIQMNILDGADIFASKAPFHLILSDMAPFTTGIHLQDTASSLEVSLMALSVAVQYLHPQGIFVCKIFQGGEIDEFYARIKKHFRRFKSFKPKATRPQSKEIYVIAREKKSESSVSPSTPGPSGVHSS